MIEQPQLGIRIKQLREKKGLTQKDLSYQCNISERTLQRIENGYVKPRKYTLKVISNILEEDLNQSVSNNAIPGKSNNNKREKIIAAFLVATVIIISFFYFLNFNNRKGTPDDIERIITEKNQNFIKLINEGDIEAVMNFYRDDACIIANGCGKDRIRTYYTDIAENYQFTDLTISNISVADTIAVEKGNWVVQAFTGEEYKGEYISEWKLSGDQWLIANEISEISAE